MHGFGRGCAARSVRRGRDPLPIRRSSVPSGLPAKLSYSRTDVAPPRRPPPATFLASQSDPPATADALSPLRQSRCLAFAHRRVRVTSPQTPVAWKSARCPWLPLSFQSQQAPHHPGDPLPILVSTASCFLPRAVIE